MTKTRKPGPPGSGKAATIPPLLSEALINLSRGFDRLAARLDNVERALRIQTATILPTLPAEDRLRIEELRASLEPPPPPDDITPAEAADAIARAAMLVATRIVHSGSPQAAGAAAVIVSQAAEDAAILCHDPERLKAEILRQSARVQRDEERRARR